MELFGLAFLGVVLVSQRIDCRGYEQLKKLSPKKRGR